MTSYWNWRVENFCGFIASFSAVFLDRKHGRTDETSVLQWWRVCWLPADGGTSWWLGSHGYWELVPQGCLLLHPTYLLGRMRCFEEPESLGRCPLKLSQLPVQPGEHRKRQGKPWQPLCYPMTTHIAPIIQGNGDTQCPGHSSLAAMAVCFGSIAFSSIQNEILQDCCFINVWSLGIFLTILREKSLEGSHMEFMKLLHVVPAHPKACLGFLFWTSWNCHPSRYVNCLLHCYLQPKLLMMYPASKGSWALVSGIYNFCLYLVQKM